MRDDAPLGPAMAALTERQRIFVHSLFLAPKSHGSLTFAARAAGYGTPTSSNNSISVMGYQLAGDPKIQAAISEVSASYLTTLGPAAVRALRKLLDNPNHRDHGRALGIVMDRVTPTQSTAVIEVRHDISPNAAQAEDALQRIAQLAAKFSVSLPAPKVINGEAVEMKQAS